VLPALFSALPLKSDLSENDNVYSCVASLLEAKNSDAMALLPQTLVATAHGLQVIPYFVPLFRLA
jgi:hypothetical protein